MLPRRGGRPVRARRLPPELREARDRFRAVVERVERAIGALADAVPTTRRPGRALAGALLEFDEELAAAQTEMPGWRLAGLETDWEACASALERARAGGERLRLAADAPVGFEGLTGTIGDLVAPLDAFVTAAERFGELRRRR